MEIRFKFDGTAQENLTWDDLEVLESGKMGASKNVIARFVVDAADQPVPYERAKKELGALKMKDIQVVLTRFLELLNDNALNPPTAA
jgi:hypothetical protein